MKSLRMKDVLRLKRMERIRAERKILEQLDHSFIIKLPWSHRDMANLYILLKYAPCGELFTCLRPVRK